MCTYKRDTHIFFCNLPSVTVGGLLRRLVFKGKDSVWPTATWQGTRLIVFYLGEDEEDVVIKETREINFDEFFLHLDCGGSIFVTTKPIYGDHERDSDHP